MALKILIAFDDSENAARAVDFAGRAFPADSSVTLFHVLQDTTALCDMHSPELTEYFKTQQSNFCGLEEQKKRLMQQAMEAARDALIQAGMPADRVDIKNAVKKKGIARDIVAEAEDGYDLIVIGRRGVSAVKEFFMGSVSQKVSNAVSRAAVLMVP